MNVQLILILSNSSIGLYKFRFELIESLINKGFRVVISVPNETYSDELVKIGCELYPLEINRRGINPIKDLVLLHKYYILVKKIKPDYVLLYTIKPNIYGGLVCQVLKTKYISNITGLGSSLQTNSIFLNFIYFLYKLSLRKAKCVFFQNTYNLDIFQKKNIVNCDNAQLIPGSGVNIDYYSLQNYPLSEKIEFAFIGRILKDKGIEEYIQAAKVIKQNYPNTIFHIYGSFESDYYKVEIENNSREGYILYHGFYKDLRDVYKKVHCVINPTSYGEGMSNVLLEAASSGRPVIASLIHGCKETFIEGVSGFGVKPKSKDDLVNVIEKFIKLSWEEKKQMGLKGREYVKLKFNRKIVIDAYLKQIENWNFTIKIEFEIPYI